MPSGRRFSLLMRVLQMHPASCAGPLWSQPLTPRDQMSPPLATTLEGVSLRQTTRLLQVAGGEDGRGGGLGGLLQFQLVLLRVDGNSVKLWSLVRLPCSRHHMPSAAY